MAEARLRLFVELVISGFAGWTIGYQVAVLAGLPAYAVLALASAAALLLAAAMTVACRRERMRGSRRPHALLAVGIVLSLSVAFAFLSTAMCRPDADDITFFHRAMVEMDHLAKPIVGYDTTSDVADLPGAPGGYLMTSLELLCAALARLVGVHPLSMFQNGMAAGASGLLPIVYYLLMRRLGLRPLVAVAGVAGVVVFLLLDGNTHHSMGNFAFVRLWQGKAVLLTVLAPYVLLVVLEYIEQPARLRWVRVLLASVAATGLSVIGCYFAPALVASASLAFGSGLLLARRIGWRAVAQRIVLTNLASAYALLVLAIVMLVPFTGAAATSQWNSTVRDIAPLEAPGVNDGGTWHGALLLPAAGRIRLLWALVAVVVAPLIALSRRRSLGLVMLVPVFVLLVANPLSGRLLFAAVPSVFWRFYFLLPVALCFGLLAASFVRLAPLLRRRRWALWRCAAGAALVAVFVATISTVTFSAANVGFTWKHPRELKLPQAEVAALWPQLDELAGRRVLADESAAVTLALLEPSVSLLAQRHLNTLGAFALLGKPDVGRRRVEAEAVAGGSAGEPEDLRAFVQTAKLEADAVVVRKAVESLAADLLAETGDTWRALSDGGVLTTFVRQDRR